MISTRRHQGIVRDLTAKHERREARLLEMIEEQQNRLMYLIGRPWEVPETPQTDDEWARRTGAELELDLAPENALVDLE